MIRIHKGIAVLFCMMLTSSCAGKTYDIFSPQKPDLIDPALQLNRDDYKSINDPKADAKTGDLSEPPIPDLAEILAAPKPPKLGETQETRCPILSVMVFIVCIPHSTNARGRLNSF